MYQIPKEINSPTEIMKGLSFVKLIFVMAYFAFFYLFQGLVHEMLVPFYYIFNFAVGIYLILPTESPQRAVIYLLLYRYIKAKNQNIYAAERSCEKEISYQGYIRRLRNEEKE